MHTETQPIMEHYRDLNRTAKPHGVVFFGSDFFASIAVGEMAYHFGITQPVFNRSIPGLQLEQIDRECINTCIADLNPSKLVMNIGENDISEEQQDIEKLAVNYEWILYTIHRICAPEIYIVPVASAHQKATQLNNRLRQLADETGCTFVDIPSTGCPSGITVFNAIKHYLHPVNIGFVDAMQLAETTACS